MTRRENASESFCRSVRSFRDLPAIVAAIWILLLFSLAGVIYGEKHPPAKPIDLNAANAKELQQLPGVGPVTAQRIIDLREKSGRFKRVEDLLAVRGISQKKLDAMRPYVTVSAQPPAAATPSQKAAPSAKKLNP
jgi:competence ComEA-like helix-hairpin-helix protein